MSNSKNLKTIVIGGTGKVGEELIEELLNSNHYSQITVLVRTPKEKWLNFPEEKKKKLKIIIKERFDFLTKKREEIEKIFSDKPYNSLFNLLGSRAKTNEEEFRRVEYTYVTESCVVCEKLHISHFIYCSSNKADKNSLLTCNKIKGEVEEEILKRNVDCVSIFHPGAITDKEQKESDSKTSKIGGFFGKFVPFVEKIKSNELAKAMVFNDLNFWEKEFLPFHQSEIINNSEILKLKDDYGKLLENEKEKNEEKEKKEEKEEKKNEEKEEKKNEEKVKKEEKKEKKNEEKEEKKNEEEKIKEE